MLTDILQTLTSTNMLNYLIAPLMVGGVLIALQRVFERRPKLFSGLLRTPIINYKKQDKSTANNRTYILFLANEGNQTANNVRISHLTLPDFIIEPKINYCTEPLRGGGTDIVIPTLAPRQIIQITYFPTSSIQWDDIVDIIRSDEVFIMKLDEPLFFKYYFVRKTIRLIITLFFYIL